MQGRVYYFLYTAFYHMQLVVFVMCFSLQVFSFSPHLEDSAILQLFSTAPNGNQTPLVQTFFQLAAVCPEFL